MDYKYEDDGVSGIFFFVFFLFIFFFCMCSCATTPKPKQPKCVAIEHNGWAEFKCKRS